VYGELLAALSAFCWAAGGAVYKKGLEYINVWSGNLMRTSTTALGFIVIMVAEGKLIGIISSITLELLFWLVISAVFAFFLGDILYLESIRRSGVAKAVPVSSTYPLFVALWAVTVYGQPLSINIFTGSVLIVFAIYLISEQKSGNRDSFGILFALFAALSWSVSISILDYLTAYLPSEAVAGFRFLIVSMLLGAVIPIKGTQLSWKAFKWLGICGMLILIVGNYAFVEAIRIVGSAKVAPISAVYPVIAAVFAHLALKELFTVRISIGTLISFLGVLLVVLA
jgi:DME family drug/metabolite transporter